MTKIIRTHKSKIHKSRKITHRASQGSITGFIEQNSTMTHKADSIKPDYVEHLSEPWFSLISLGLKTVEGRKNKGRFKDMKVGEVIEWHNDDFKPRKFLTRIVKKVEYPTFKKYLETETIEKCLPGIPSMDHALSVYFKYFTKEDEEQYGVMAIHLERV